MTLDGVTNMFGNNIPEQSHRNSNVSPKQLLTTEAPHPLTAKLSDLAQADLLAGYRVLQKVDQQALERLLNFEKEATQLAQTFFETLRSGSKVMMGGCGAAARAAIVAEKLFRAAFPQYANQVIAMIAGGDSAIVRAAEGFEDSPEYGRDQLRASNWEAGDLYVGISASGAAAFVSGQVEYVLSQVHKRNPIFLICNPLSECLIRFAENSKTVFDKTKIAQRKNIDFLEICIGEMALSGSTRMQAATAQLIVLGFALLQAGQMLIDKTQKFSYRNFILSLQNFLKQLPFQELSTLTRFEVDAYAKGKEIVYSTKPETALTVATDTTERSPTFGWPYLENKNDIDEKKSEQSGPRCRVEVSGYTDNAAAFTAMLSRDLRVLNWQGKPKTTSTYLLGYNLAENKNVGSERIHIHINNEHIEIKCSQRVIKLPLLSNDNPPALLSLYKQLALKMILNSHSTLVAGRMRFYSGNTMTFVLPGNEKLINRVVSLVSHKISETNFEERRLPPFIKNRITRDQITEMLRSMMLIHRHGSIVFQTRDAVLEKWEKLCYLWLFNHIQHPSEMLGLLGLDEKKLAVNPQTKPSVPLISDIEIAIDFAGKNRNILCIEGGGTYFRFSVLSNQNGPLVLQGFNQAGTTIMTTGGNYNAIKEKFFTLIDDALNNITIGNQKLTTFIRMQQPIIVIGMAGMGAELNRQILRDHLTKNHNAKRQHTIITSDADTYLAALPSSYGAILIAGTGSICLGLTPQGGRIQAGGFGAHLSADPGSAFAVGRRAVLGYLNLLNGTNIWDDSTNSFITSNDPLYSFLTKNITEILEVKPSESLVAYLNREHADRLKMAKLSTPVFKCAFEEKSLLAKKIVNETAKELAEQLGGTINAILEKNVDLKKLPFNVILVGGLFENEHRKHFLELIEQQLVKICPDTKVNWQCNPTANYVSQVVQSITMPVSAGLFSQQNKAMFFHSEYIEPIVVSAYKTLRH